MDGWLTFNGKIMWRPIFHFPITFEWIYIFNAVFCKVSKIYLTLPKKRLMLIFCDLGVKIGDCFHWPLKFKIYQIFSNISTTETQIGNKWMQNVTMNMCGYFCGIWGTLAQFWGTRWVKRVSNCYLSTISPW